MVDWVELGRIGGPFGVKGWLKVRSYTDPPEGLLGYRRWQLRVGTGERSERRLLEGQSHGGGLVVRLEGIASRAEAGTLSGAVIEVARAALPPAGERQFYRADLIGLRVRNLEGVTLGMVEHFLEAPGNAVMVVQGDGQHWVPATPRHLCQVDVEAGWIVVDWPAQVE